MEYNSFYGGRRGASFIISKSFKTIFAPAENNTGFNKIIRMDLGLEENATITTAQRNAWLAENCMVYCFSQGGAYQTVHYDEYVIIDTYNKNDIDNGKIYFKTDDDELFEGSLGYFEEAGFTIESKTYDLHAEPIWENNIETEHEKMFSEKGIKIKALIAKYNK